MVGIALAWLAIICDSLYPQTFYTHCLTSCVKSKTFHIKCHQISVHLIDVLYNFRRSNDKGTADGRGNNGFYVFSILQKIHIFQL